MVDSRIVVCSHCCPQYPLRHARNLNPSPAERSRLYPRHSHTPDPAQRNRGGPPPALYILRKTTFALFISDCSCTLYQTTGSTGRPFRRGWGCMRAARSTHNLMLSNGDDGEVWVSFHGSWRRGKQHMESSEEAVPAAGGRNGGAVGGLTGSASVCVCVHVVSQPNGSAVTSLPAHSTSPAYPVLTFRPSAYDPHQPISTSCPRKAQPPTSQSPCADAAA